jgi:hypothetical protein
MPLFTKHRAVVYQSDGAPISSDDIATGKRVLGFSNARGKPSRKPLEFEVTEDRAGKKRFTLRGMLGS